MILFVVYHSGWVSSYNYSYNSSKFALNLPYLHGGFLEACKTTGLNKSETVVC